MLQGAVGSLHFGRDDKKEESFNHLSTSKAEPDFARDLILEARERLEAVGFTVGFTPFGYLNEWKLHVAGDSLAKVFKEI